MSEVFNELLEKYPKLASIALNKTATRYRTISAQKVREQVNLPASYVSPSQGRLVVSKKSSNTDLEARLSARSRATSLARFAKGSPKKGYNKSVPLEVGVGKTSIINNVVMVNLKGSDTLRNLGLAVRSKTRPTGAYIPRQLGNSDLWLLFGPSVAQVLAHKSDENGLWDKADREVLNNFKAEFYRLIGV